MRTRPLFLLLSVALAACGNSNGLGDSGADAGQPFVPTSCAAIGATCSGNASCCGNLTCQSGTCETPAPICAGFQEPCGNGVDCCGVDAGTLSCQTVAGISVCLSGYQGAPCTTNAQCTAPFVCASGACDFPQTNVTCSGSNCHPGDNCSSAADSIDENREDLTSLDPCSSSGLTCYVLGEDATGSLEAVCIQPMVSHPPSFPYPDGAPFDSSVCDSNSASCVADQYGAPRAAPVCGGFFFDPFGNAHCFDSCTTSEDCGSIAEDCVGNVCVINYCFAAGNLPLGDGGMEAAAQLLTPYQVANGGDAISGDPQVLFTPCPDDAGFPRSCLPQYDDLLNTAGGLCVRVGAADAGGWGAFCDPLPYRNNPNGYCAPGTFCDKGTCLPWCDLGTSNFVQCPDNTVCSRLPAGSALNSTAAGTPNAIGVCTETCNPYVTTNQCTPFVTDGGQPTLVCKFSESQNDRSPAPGMCVDGVASPIAIGKSCNPFGWADPCVSGAECVSVTDGGPAFVCAQLCDPQPSPGVDVPACPSGTTCQGLLLSACQGLPCPHEGTCQ